MIKNGGDETGLFMHSDVSLLLSKHSTLSSDTMLSLHTSSKPRQIYFFLISFQNELRRYHGKSYIVVILQSMSLALNKRAVFTEGFWKKSFPYKLRN